MSDIVFLRAWTQVEVPKFYNPLTNALQPHDETWKGMKTVAELRRESNLQIPVNKDSLYKVSLAFGVVVFVHMRCVFVNLFLAGLVFKFFLKIAGY